MGFWPTLLIIEGPWGRWRFTCWIGLQLLLIAVHLIAAHGLVAYLAVSSVIVAARHSRRTYCRLRTCVEVTKETHNHRPQNRDGYRCVCRHGRGNPAHRNPFLRRKSSVVCVGFY